MRDLLQCRDDIDRIDSSILELLKERMAVANDIAQYKLEHNQAITDALRERQKLQKLRERATKEQLPPSFVSDVFKTIIKHTCAVEQHYIVAKANNSTICRDSSVAFLGSTGSYSHVAALKYLEGYRGKIEAVGCPTFSDVVAKVENGITEYAVLPVENSSSGSINDVLDVIQNTKACIVGELHVPIAHAVLGVDGASLSEVTDVYSHPQPVTQCSAYLKNILPNVKIHYTKATSEAMEIVKKLNDKSHVAIGSIMAAPMYDLISLADGIANNPHNFTRFIVLSLNPITVPETVPAKTSLIFSVQRYQPGSLIKVLEKFQTRDINMTKLISRPRINSNSETWEEIFFTELEGNMSGECMQEVIEDIRPYTSFLKVLGCYPNPEKSCLA